MQEKTHQVFIQELESIFNGFINMLKNLVVAQNLEKDEGKENEVDIKNVSGVITMDVSKAAAQTMRTLSEE